MDYRHSCVGFLNNHHFIIQNIIGRLFLLLINMALEKLTMHACFQVFQTNIGRNNSIPKMKPLLFTREMREQNQRMYKKKEERNSEKYRLVLGYYVLIRGMEYHSS